MPSIRPVLTNFRLGEIDPRLAGRVDLGLSQGAANEITNAKTHQYGGVYKRGGMQYRAIIDSVSSGEYRIIPWSLGENDDILVILSDKKIRFYRINPTEGFILDGTDPFAIEQIDWQGTYYDAYAASDIYDVQYVTYKNNMYMVHNKYPPLVITVNGDTVSYNSFTITSNLAVTAAPEKAKTTMNKFSSDTVLSLLRPFVNDFSQTTETKEFTSADGLTGTLSVNGVDTAITKIQIVRETIYDRATVGGVEIIESSDDSIVQNALGYSIPYFNGRKVVGSGYIKNNYSYLYAYAETIPGHWSKIPTGGKGTTYTLNGNEGNLKDLLPCDTTFNFLNYCRSHFAPKTSYYANFTASGDVYSVTPYQSSTTSLYPNTPKEIVFYPGSTKYTVTFYNDTTVIGTMTNQATTELVGWFDITNYSVSVNGQKTLENDVSEMIDYLSAWMFTDRPYDVPSGYTFCNKTPVKVTKTIQEDKPTLQVLCDDGTVINIDKTMSSISGQLAIRLNPIIHTTDFPGVVAIWQGRLCIGGSVSLPNVVFMSKVNDHFDFTFFEEIEYTSTVMTPEDEWADPSVPEYETLVKKVQQTGADSAIRFMVMTEEKEEVKALSGADDLFIATSTSEFIIPKGSTALNFALQMVSRNGASKLQPRFMRDAIVFVGASKRVVFTFNKEQRVDLFAYAKHIIDSDIVQIDYRSDPEFEIYITLANGDVLVGVIQDQSMAWQRISTAGHIYSTAVIALQDEDAVYMITERDGGALLERLTTIKDYTFENRPYLDCYTYIGSATDITSIGRSVVPLDDGTDIVIHYVDADGNEGDITTTLTSTNISIDPALHVRKLFVGLPYLMRVETWRMDSVETEGIVKSVVAVHFRLFNSSGFSIRKDETDVFMVPIPDYDGVEQVTYTGPVRFDLLSPWDTDKSIEIESYNGYPVNILVIMPEYVLGEDL